MKYIFYALIALFMLTAEGQAQIEHPVKWSYAAKKLNNKETLLFLKANIEVGWHIYSADMKDGGPVKTSLYFLPDDRYVLRGKIIEPVPTSRHEDVYDMDIRYFEKSVVFYQKIKLNDSNLTAIKGSVRFMACTDKRCLPPETVEFSIRLK